jgi:branched-chain amino acid aminotransferase
MAGKDVATMKIGPKVWRNGEFLDWDDARIHVMSHVVNYGSSVFEGIRCYETSKGSRCFQAYRTHAASSEFGQDLSNGLAFDRQAFCDATVDLIADSGLESCYIRPLIMRGLDEDKPSFGVNPFGSPVDAYIAIWQWGKYLGEEAIENGIDVCVSSWTRITSNSMPAMAKSGCELHEFAAY